MNYRYFESQSPESRLSPEPVRPLASAESLRVGSVTLHPGDSHQTRREKLARVVLDAMYQFVGLLDAE